MAQFTGIPLALEYCQWYSTAITMTLEYLKNNSTDLFGYSIANGTVHWNSNGIGILSVVFHGHSNDTGITKRQFH